MEIKKFKTSKERLEQCGWELELHNVISSRFTKEIGYIKVNVGVDTETYELYYIEVSSGEDEHCAAFSFPELLLMVEKIKELEVK